MTSLSETYLDCKAAFAAQLANKGVTASSSEGLTTLINNIADIEQGTCTNGIFLYAGKDICQTSDTVGVGAVAVSGGKLIDDTITVYRSDMAYQNKLTSGTASEWLIQDPEDDGYTGFTISSTGATLASDGRVYLNKSLDIKNDSHIIEFDCKPLSESSASVFGQIYYDVGGSGYYESFWIGSSGGTLCDDSFSLPSGYNFGDWAHVRLEWTPTEQKIYIDGTLADTTTQDYSGASTYDDLYLTLWGNNGGFIVKNMSVLTNPASVCTGSHGACVGTYTGAGRGKTEFVAVCGSVQSEPCPVIDALYDDKVTSDTSSNYYLRTDLGNTLTYSNGYLVYSKGTGSTYVRLNSLSSSVVGKKITMQVDLVLDTGTSVNIRAYSNATILKTVNATSSGTYILEDVTFSDDDTRTNIFNLELDTGNGFKFKNFAVWISG